MAIDLTHEIYHNMPVYPTLPDLSINLIGNHSRDGFEARELKLITHHGTHIDAPKHIIEGGKSIDEYPISYFLGRAVILNMTYKKPKDEITSEDLKTYENIIAKNEIVLLNTGWSKKRMLNKEYLYQWPYLDIDGAKFLSNYTLKMVGTDGLSIAGYSSLNDPVIHVIETHTIFLKKDILIIEELNFNNLPDELREKTYIEGYAIVLPLPIKDADGSLVRAVFFI